MRRFELLYVRQPRKIGGSLMLTLPRDRELTHQKPLYVYAERSQTSGELILILSNQPLQDEKQQELFP